MPPTVRQRRPPLSKLAPATFAGGALIIGLALSSPYSYADRSLSAAAATNVVEQVERGDSLPPGSPAPRLTAIPAVEQTASPKTPLIRSRPLVVGPPAKFEVPKGGGHTIYLTFDDGPDPTWTPRILAVLRRYHVPATFFVIGYSVKDHPALLKAEVATGSLVENHTSNHAYLTHVPLGELLATEITPVNRAIERITGTTPKCVRPPYGAFNSAVRAEIGSIGMRLALWDVDPTDWARPGTAAIRNSVLAGLHPGAVVIMHDGGGDRSQTVAALAELLPRLLAAHWTFGTLCH
jgi:peptidoglycan/xylan/chitin deacetylase (PgdA/CDA1 family)